MRIIFKIARNELRQLFYSPIAWFVMLVFLVECAVFYSTAVYDLAISQDILLKNSPEFKGVPDPLTVEIFIRKGLFRNVISNLYLFIPILTMGLISREINSGSVKLLYSSPASLPQIVLGKYLGIMLYNTLLVAVLGIFIVTGAINIQHVDYGMLLSAAFGFYLLVCTYSAIGLFMSSLTTYQIVSALSTLVIIFVLGRIGGLWQRYDVLRDLTWFLSLQNRTGKMLVGLMVTRDVFYFIIVSSLFIAFTLIKLRAGREVRPWYVKAGRYMGVTMVALCLGYISSRPTLTAYVDTTAAKFNTIPKEMQQLIGDMGDSTLEVTLYTNLLGAGLGYGLPEARNASYMAEMWEPYLRFKPDIIFKYEYYYDTDGKSTDSAIYKQFGNKSLKEIAAESADAIDYDLSPFKSPEQMHKTIDLRPEGYQLLMQLKYRNRTEWLRTYPFGSPPWPGLHNVSAVFKRLLEPTRIPKVYFVSGDLERSTFKAGEREYAGHTASKGSSWALVNTGYDVDTLNLAVQDIPSDSWELVLADPKMELSRVVQGKLKKYIDRGGNMLIIGEPGKQSILNPFLNQLGVELMQGQLVEPTYDETPDKVNPYFTANTDALFNRGETAYKKELASGDSATLLMPGATALQYTNDRAFRVQPLLMTRPGRTWFKAGELVIDSTLPPLDPTAGDVIGKSFSTSVILTRKVNNKEQRIAIYGDADFASNQRGQPPTDTYSWMSYNEFPVHMTEIDSKDHLLRIGERGAAIQKIFFVWVLPGLVLLAGTILLVRRKRK